jgi:hypothetical protein
MNTYTIYPRHDVKSYEVAEYNIVEAPPELWPMIQQWTYERQASETQSQLATTRRAA